MEWMKELTRLQRCELYRLDFEIVVFPHLPLLNLELKSDFSYKTLWKTSIRLQKQIYSVLRGFQTKLQKHHALEVWDKFCMKSYITVRQEDFK